jgi:hypothetical protein
MERRRSNRARCRIPCDVSVRGKTIEATVRNVSEGGLALEAPPHVGAEGDSLTLTLKPRGRPPIEVVALLWHTRALRGSRGPAAVVHLGLVLSEAEDDYFRLVELLSGRAASAPTSGARVPGARQAPRPDAPRVQPSSPEPPAPELRGLPGPEPPAPPPTPDPPPALSFTVQVVQAGSPRTRRILVRAPDADAARERALEETGPGWSVVSAEPARRT